MTAQRYDHSAGALSSADGTDPPDPRMLVVGIGREVDHLAFPGSGDGFIFVTYAEVTAGLLQRLEPDLVLSRLIGDHFDAVELAKRLVAAGFQGRYRAVTYGLPNPSLIEAEVRCVAPSLDFEILRLDEP